jgi:hypothetical protein
MQNAWEQLPWWPAPTVGRIPGDSEHGRAQGLGQKKEDDEGIRFHSLPMVERHRGGGNLARKKVVAHCSSSLPSDGRREKKGEKGRAGCMFY